MGCHGALLNSSSPHPSCTLKFTTGLSKSKVGNLWKRWGTGASETSSKGTQTETGQPLPPPGSLQNSSRRRWTSVFSVLCPNNSDTNLGTTSASSGPGLLAPSVEFVPIFLRWAEGTMESGPRGRWSRILYSTAPLSAVAGLPGSSPEPRGPHLRGRHGPR